MKQDSNTLGDSNQITVKLPHGVTFRPAITHFDERGSVCELFDERWGWTSSPLVFSYMFTLRPNKIKGWGAHAA